MSRRPRRVCWRDQTWGSDDSDAMESYARSLVALEAFVEAALTVNLSHPGSF